MLEQRPGLFPNEGQENWVQPFKLNQLEGFCFWKYGAGWVAVRTENHVFNMGVIVPDHSGSMGRGIKDATIAQLILLTAAMAVFTIIATGMGYIKVPADDVIKIIIPEISGQIRIFDGIDSLFPVVVMDVRLPRILTSAIVGGGLAVSGVVFRGILLNPLADPYTLGVSAGAAFGASLAILLNVGFLGLYSVPVFAFGGAVVTLLLVIYLSASSGGLSSNNLILSGIIGSVGLLVPHMMRTITVPDNRRNRRGKSPASRKISILTFRLASKKS